jgi:hypothetical protein
MKSALPDGFLRRGKVLGMARGILLTIVVGGIPLLFSKGIAMTNFIARLAITTAKAIREKISMGNPWEVSDFQELVLACENENLDRRTTRSAVYTVLDMIPRMTKESKAEAWEAISLEYLPPKSYTTAKVNLSELSDADIEAHLARVFAAKAKAKA